MIKRSLYFSNAAILRYKNKQLEVYYPKMEERIGNVPVEDIGLVVIDHPQILISQPLIDALIEVKAAILYCNAKHMPHGMILPFTGNSLWTARFHTQREASLPLKKNIWRQIIQSKIANQARLLEIRKKDNSKLLPLMEKVLSGDSTNVEGKAASYYWRALFEGFVRSRDGAPPNNLLNFGYAILRSIVARGLISTGLHPMMGVNHKNQYNHFCLADDVMEPYRPFVDDIVLDLYDSCEDISVLTKEIKAELMRIASRDVLIQQRKSPLMAAVSRTTASLFACMEGNTKKILCPEFI
jgi:CRISP-associated protein Cas1